ncbi:hypothetical protein [Arenicella xantha]|uniref:Uncharacterized protein n=1 Tax=Arenicella xantha TaxID=644221 RepID=A0A395JMF8_9GAMM|nr:hypothetical protein [Arenicella xantha]RBP52831.1 hypothetical protein DFR28_101215 [Arenicella xantha]
MYNEILTPTKLTGRQLQKISNIARQTHSMTSRTVSLRDPELFTKLEIILRQAPLTELRTHLLDNLHQLAEELRHVGTIHERCNLVVEDYQEFGLCVSYVESYAA